MCVLSGMVAATMAFSAGAANAADMLKIGAGKTDAAAPVMIAVEKGYFAKEGLDASIVFTDQPQILPQAVMSGDVDFVIAGMVAAFFNVAGDGTMRMLAGNVNESPGFKAQAVIVSNQAFAAGLKGMRDLGGHSFAIFAAGTPQQYDASILADKYHFDYASLKMAQLGTMPNMVSAVVGGSADAAVAPAPFIRLPLAEGKIVNLGWIGDELSMTVTAVVTSRKIADTRNDFVSRFLRAYQAGARDYHDAFIGPNETLRDGPTAADDYAILAKYLNQPIDVIKSGLPHIDRDARLDVNDVRHQIEWYKSQGMVKPEVDAAKMIDTRYVVPLP